MPHTFGVNNGENITKGEFNSEIGLTVYKDLQGQSLIDSRELQKKLENKRNHNPWMDDNISWGFQLGQDFWIRVSKTTGRARKSYYMSLDMAKHVCMIQKSAVGMAIRQKFIDWEKTSRQIIGNQTLDIKNISYVIAQAVTTVFTQALGTTIMPIVNQQSELISRLMERMDRAEIVKEKQQRHIQNLTTKPLRDMCNLLISNEVSRLFKKPLDEDYRNVRGMLYQEFKRIVDFEFPAGCKNKIEFLEKNGLIADFYNFLIERRDSKERLF